MNINYNLNKIEQETIINTDNDNTSIMYDRSEPMASVYTADRNRMKKLDKLCEQYPDVYTCYWVDDLIMKDGKPRGKKYSFPTRFLKFSKPASKAQIEAARANMSKINSKA